jgi:hypothetical protein
MDDRHAEHYRRQPGAFHLQAESFPIRRSDTWALAESVPCEPCQAPVGRGCWTVARDGFNAICGQRAQTGLRLVAAGRRP